MKPRFKPYINWRELRKIFSFNFDKVKRFEEKFANKFGALEAVSFSYGRSAQWAFFKALKIEKTEVIMPAYTCSVVAHAVNLSGNTPKFIDITLDDYNMNLKLLENAINERTSTIITTHTFGCPQNMDEILRIVKEAEKRYKKKIWIMQDCCHAFGAKWGNKLVGSYGDVAVYAFNISKMITSIFGGMLTFNDKDLALKVKIWRDQNFKKPSIIKSLKRRIYLIAVYFAFNEMIYGFIYFLKQNTNLIKSLTDSYHLDDKIHFPPDYLDKMIDLEAAVGIEQLDKYDEIIMHRKQKAVWYNNNLKKVNGWKFPKVFDEHTFSHYVVLVPNRKEVLDEYKNKGIELGELIQYSIPELKSYAHLKSHCPNAKTAAEKTINFSVSKS